MKRIAVLVDGDNLSPDHARRILQEGRRCGRVDIAQVYLNAARGNDWLRAPGFRAVHCGTGKNAGDLLLSIEAMEMALTQGVEGVVLASSDGDFQHLAQRLRWHGVAVHGIGQAHAPESFRAACDSFAVVGAAANAPAPAAAPSAAAPPRLSGVTDLDRKARALIARHGCGGQAMPLARFGVLMHRECRETISDQPERTWRSYFAARPALYDLDPRGPEAMVRLRREGFGG